VRSTMSAAYLLDEPLDAGDQEFELHMLVRRYSAATGDEAVKAVGDGAGFVVQRNSISANASCRACECAPEGA
jgi:hypothetical protein